MMMNCHENDYYEVVSSEDESFGVEEERFIPQNKNYIDSQEKIDFEELPFVPKFSSEIRNTVESAKNIENDRTQSQFVGDWDFKKSNPVSSAPQLNCPYFPDQYVAPSSDSDSVKKESNQSLSNSISRPNEFSKITTATYQSYTELQPNPLLHAVSSSAIEICNEQVCKDSPTPAIVDNEVKVNVRESVKCSWADENGDPIQGAFDQIGETAALDSCVNLVNNAKVEYVFHVKEKKSDVAAKIDSDSGGCSEGISNGNVLSSFGNLASNCVFTPDTQTLFSANIPDASLCATSDSLDQKKLYEASKNKEELSKANSENENIASTSGNEIDNKDVLYKKKVEHFVFKRHDFISQKKNEIDSETFVEIEPAAATTSTADKALESQALNELLKEVKLGAERAKSFGALAWQKQAIPVVNKRFLRNTLVSTLRKPYKPPKKRGIGHQGLDKDKDRRSDSSSSSSRSRSSSGSSSSSYSSSSSSRSSRSRSRSARDKSRRHGRGGDGGRGGGPQGAWAGGGPPPPGGQYDWAAMGHYGGGYPWYDPEALAMYYRMESYPEMCYNDPQFWAAYCDYYGIPAGGGGGGFGPPGFRGGGGGPRGRGGWRGRGGERGGGGRGRGGDNMNMREAGEKRHGRRRYSDSESRSRSRSPAASQDRSRSKRSRSDRGDSRESRRRGGRSTSLDRGSRGSSSRTESAKNKTGAGEDLTEIESRDSKYSKKDKKPKSSRRSRSTSHVSEKQEVESEKNEKKKKMKKKAKKLKTNEKNNEDAAADPSSTKQSTEEKEGADPKKDGEKEPSRLKKVTKRKLGEKDGDEVKTKKKKKKTNSSEKSDGKGKKKKTGSGLKGKTGKSCKSKNKKDDGIEGVEGSEVKNLGNDGDSSKKENFGCDNVELDKNSSKNGLDEKSDDIVIKNTEYSETEKQPQNKSSTSTEEHLKQKDLEPVKHDNGDQERKSSNSNSLIEGRDEEKTQGNVEENRSRSENKSKRESSKRSEDVSRYGRSRGKEGRNGNYENEHRNFNKDGAKDCRIYKKTDSITSRDRDEPNSKGDDSNNRDKGRKLSKLEEIEKRLKERKEKKRLEEELRRQGEGEGGGRRGGDGQDRESKGSFHQHGNLDITDTRDPDKSKDEVQRSRKIETLEPQVRSETQTCDSEKLTKGTNNCKKEKKLVKKKVKSKLKVKDGDGVTKLSSETSSSKGESGEKRKKVVKKKKLKVKAKKKTEADSETSDKMKPQNVGDSQMIITSEQGVDGAIRDDGIKDQ